MSTLTVAFANMYQGLIYEGIKDDKDIFSKFWPSAYQELYLAHGPDIVCLVEVPLDDEHGHSVFLDKFAAAFGAANYYADVHEQSWLVEGKYYGNAILSKHPLTDYTALPLPNPRLEVDRPGGQHWTMHDKSVQTAVAHVDGQIVRLFNVHYFPFHHFNRRLREAAFEPSRRAFLEQLCLEDGVPTLLAGDFNNSNDALEEAFPELFANNTLQTALQFTPKQLKEWRKGKWQRDHILYTPAQLKVTHGKIVGGLSDHPGLTVTFELGA